MSKCTIKADLVPGKDNFPIVMSSFSLHRYTTLYHRLYLLAYLLLQLKASTLKTITVEVKGEKLHTFKPYVAQSKFILG